MISDLSALCVTPGTSIREVIVCIDKNSKGIALVVDSDRRLIGTITDGDIRRAILAGIDLNLPVERLLEKRAPTSHPTPLTARVGTPEAEILHLMNEYSLHHIPLVDEDLHVVDVAMLSDFGMEYELPLAAVIMAGGYGTRLRPLTENVPKPMLPLGDRPILEWTIQQLRDSGIRRVNLTTHYKKDLIAQHFGDGRDFGVEIEYVVEDQPLGTAGALSLLEKSDEPLLVINGDILTRVDFRAMRNFHQQQRADMTVAVRQYEFRVPYGVVETDGIVITNISEKPVVRHFINAGIYLLNPDVRWYIPNGQPSDMPDLISRLIHEKRRVVSFPIREYWLDIGKIEDYQKALSDMKNGEI